MFYKADGCEVDGRTELCDLSVCVMCLRRHDINS